MTDFEQVSNMNIAFGNPKGDPDNIHWSTIRSQCLNILDEFIELQDALGLNKDVLSTLIEVSLMLSVMPYDREPNIEGIRDALCDINVFSYGAHHKMGIDADKDMQSVIEAVMSRFIKNERDEEQTVDYHRSKGIASFALEGNYPTVIMRSLANQPDAPRGKFLKSVSSTKPIFYDPFTKDFE